MYKDNLSKLENSIKELKQHVKKAEGALPNEISLEERAVVNIAEDIGRHAFALRLSALEYLRKVRRNA